MRKTVIATTSVCLTLTLIASGDDVDVMATLKGETGEGAPGSGSNEKLILPNVKLTAGSHEQIPVATADAAPEVRMSSIPSVPVNSLGITPKATAREKTTFSQVALSVGSENAPVKARRHLVRLRAMALDLPAYPATGAPDSQFAAVSAEIGAKAGEGHTNPIDPEAASAFARTSQAFSWVEVWFDNCRAASIRDTPPAMVWRGAFPSEASVTRAAASRNAEP